MIKYINNLNFFAGIDNEKLKVLADISKTRSYESGEIMNYEEDDINRVFFLLEGEAKLYKVDKNDNEIFLYILYAHDLLTNIGSLKEERVSCFSNIEFLKESKVISFGMGEFKTLVKSENALLQNLVDVLASQKQMLDCMVNMGMVYDGTAKVAFMLYKNLEEFNHLKKQEIAYRLNIQPATLSRILAKLIKQNILSEDKHYISISDNEKLFELFHH